MGMERTLVDISLVYVHILYFYYILLVIEPSEYLPPTFIYHVTSLQVILWKGKIIILLRDMSSSSSCS